MDEVWGSLALRPALVILAAAPLLSLVPAARQLKPTLWLTSLASALVLAAAIAVVWQGGEIHQALWSTSRYTELELRLDPLGALFAAVIAGVALASSLFATSYAHHRPLDDALYPLFVLSMLVVVSAANVYTFLVGWEAMALTSFFLVIGSGVPRARRQSAILYLVMTHVASVLVAASFFIVAHETGTTSFAGMAESPVTGTVASIAFVFALAGFGTKAGLIPLHIWLPRAHPVAPSHVSALMSAAMVKTGIYGIVRVCFVFLAPGEAWWGVLLICLGVLSAVLGVLYALMEQDIKRILAYSTVENVGIICLALGVAMTLRNGGQPELAAMALLAALLHTANHAWFKTLMFLAAGSVQTATHSLNIDRLGGLLRRMPHTGVAVLVGSLSIAALPPFNGFVGEWLLLRSLLELLSSPASDVSKLTAIVALGSLALVGGLAVACFVRLYGIAFLGVARNEHAEAAVESPRAMHLTLGLLAAGCLATGLAAPWILRWMQPISQIVAGTQPVEVSDGHLLELAGGASISPAVIAGALIVLAPLPWLLLRAFAGANSRDRGPVWTTGVAFRPSMQYTGGSFAKPIRLFFSPILLPERQIKVSYHGSSPLPRLVSYTGRVPAVFEERFYYPGRQAAFWLASRLRLLQNGSVQVYLFYIMAALTVLVLVSGR